MLEVAVHLYGGLRGEPPGIMGYDRYPASYLVSYDIATRISAQSSQLLEGFGTVLAISVFECPGGGTRWTQESRARPEMNYDSNQVLFVSLGLEAPMPHLFIEGSGTAQSSLTVTISDLTSACTSVL